MAKWLLDNINNDRMKLVAIHQDNGRTIPKALGRFSKTATSILTLEFQVPRAQQCQKRGHELSQHLSSAGSQTT